MSCICEGNKIIREKEHMRDLAKKAAKMDGVVYVLVYEDGIYRFCQETEVSNKDNIVELIYP